MIDHTVTRRATAVRAIAHRPSLVKQRTWHTKSCKNKPTPQLVHFSEFVLSASVLGAPTPPYEITIIVYTPLLR